MSDPPRGIRATKTGFRTFIRVNGRLYSKRWKGKPLLSDMRDWLSEQRLLALGRVESVSPDESHSGTLAADVRTYLEMVESMPSYVDRAYDLQCWVKALGARTPRASITPVRIRTILEQWRKTYSASTCNHRRTALSAMFTALDGRNARNPVRDVPKFYDDSQDAPPPPLSDFAATLIFGHMPESQTRARLVLFRWTGWPPAQMAKLRPTDVRWDDAVFVRPRRKGQGVKGRWLPLLPQAWDALREFKRLGCWGVVGSNGKVKRWSAGSQYKSFRLACRHARRTVAKAYAERTIDRADARAIRTELLTAYPYQLRHTFATMVAGATKDDRAAQELLQHADIRMTRRYTEHTANPRAVAALESVAARLRAAELPKAD